MNLIKLISTTIFFCTLTLVNSQIVYNWQNSKEGWISGGDCNLTAQPDAMAMRLYSSNGKMISGNASSNLGIYGGDYNKIDITVKNPTSGSGVARLFIYPPGAANNNDTCYYTFDVDTSMSSFSTYTISLDSIPSGGINSVYTGPIARFGLRAPWGGANFDTIFWKQMIVYNTNQPNDSVNITFNVDMSQVNDSYNIPEINGDFNAWCGNCDVLSDNNNDNIWEITLPFQVGDTVQYLFSADSWAIQEVMDPSLSCTNSNVNFANRMLVIPSNDSVLAPVCWESCDPCLNAIEPHDFSFNLFPNPAVEFIHISANRKVDELFLRDLTGKIVKYSKPNQKSFKLDIRDLANQIYMLECIQDNQQLTKWVIVNH